MKFHNCHHENAGWAVSKSISILCPTLNIGCLILWPASHIPPNLALDLGSICPQRAFNWKTNLMFILIIYLCKSAFESQKDDFTQSKWKQNFYENFMEMDKLNFYNF